MNSFWDVDDLRWYQKMRWRHKSLWRYVLTFIKDNNIKNIFEVGGAEGILEPLVEKYNCIELNEAICKGKKNFIYGDFHSVDVSKYNNPDLFIALAVVEHCNGYKEFIKKAISMNPKFIVINFFLGLSIKDDKIRRKTYRKGLKKGEEYWFGRYSRKGLEGFLKEQGVLDKVCIISLPCNNGIRVKEDVLIINLGGIKNGKKD